MYKGIELLDSMKRDYDNMLKQKDNTLELVVNEVCKNRKSLDQANEEAKKTQRQSDTKVSQLMTKQKTLEKSVREIKHVKMFMLIILSHSNCFYI